jgi:hypothetical protein
VEVDDLGCERRQVRKVGREIALVRATDEKIGTAHERERLRSRGQQTDDTHRRDAREATIPFAPNDPANYPRLCDLTFWSVPDGDGAPRRLCARSFPFTRPLP